MRDRLFIVLEPLKEYMFQSMLLMDLNVNPLISRFSCPMAAMAVAVAASVRSTVLRHHQDYPMNRLVPIEPNGELASLRHLVAA
jgi:hypothetical protein